MKILLHSILIILSTFIISSCSTSKNGGNDSDCSTLATVKDFTGLDGCTFLFILDNGDKYLPAEISDSNFELKDQQRIKFGYKELKDQMSICMAENKIVAVTCIQVVE